MFVLAKTNKSKIYYYIPKYYIEGYDGDHLWISLTKDEVNTRFEKEKTPSSVEFETPEYMIEGLQYKSSIQILPLAFLPMRHQVQAQNNNKTW